MGCDIHIFVETKDEEKKTWHLKEGWYQTETEEYNGELLEFLVETNQCAINFRRSYIEFDMLAGVTSERSFRKEKNLEPIIRISGPKGVPIDASLDYQKVIKRWGSDGHSYSYFTLRQLKDLERDGYWENKFSDKTYRKLGKQIIQIIDTLTEIEIKENLCHNCIRIVFFFDN